MITMQPININEICGDQNATSISIPTEWTRILIPRVTGSIFPTRSKIIFIVDCKNKIFKLTSFFIISQEHKIKHIFSSNTFNPAISFYIIIAILAINMINYICIPFIFILKLFLSFRTLNTTNKSYICKPTLYYIIEKFILHKIQLQKK